VGEKKEYRDLMNVYNGETGRPLLDSKQAPKKLVEIR
jgi:hypothetical protein